MSKYDPLWVHVGASGADALSLSFAEIEKIAGVALDHSFLKYKRELMQYGYRVERVFLKAQRVSFVKLEDDADVEN